MCRVAKARMVLLCSEAPVLDQTGESGLYVAEATPTENNDDCLNVARRIAEALPHLQLYIMGANTSKMLTRLIQNMKAVTLGKALIKSLPGTREYCS